MSYNGVDCIPTHIYDILSVIEFIVLSLICLISNKVLIFQESDIVAAGGA